MLLRINELCTNKRKITADTALMLARVFGNTAEFWMNLKQRIDQARPLQTNVA